MKTFLETPFCKPSVRRTCSLKLKREEQCEMNLPHQHWLAGKLKSVQTGCPWAYSQVGWWPRGLSTGLYLEQRALSPRAWLAALRSLPLCFI